MAEEVKTNAGTPEKPAVKKIRRGVSNETQAVAQLKFHEKDVAQNGLFTGHLEEVKVEWSVNNEAKVFTGLCVPRLTYHFTSNHSNINERRHVFNTLFPVESTVKTIPGGKEEWRVNNMLKWIKHILDVFYLKGRQMTPEEEDALSLPFADFDENGGYVVLDIEEVLNGYATLFNNVAAIMNGKGLTGAEVETAKPCYLDVNGKPISIWMKLLRHKRTKDGWINVGQNGELGFDQFIGAGCIELLKPNTPPSILRIDLAKESITPKDTTPQPTIGTPGMGMAMGGVMLGADSNVMAGAPNPVFAAGADEMPF